MDDKIKKIGLILKLFDEKILTVEETIEKVKIVIKEIDKKSPIKKEKREKIKLFSPLEIGYIKKNEKKLGITQIAKNLGRTYQTIYNKIQKMKLKANKKKEDGRKSIWTEEKRRKLSRKIKKIWKERKTNQHKRKRKIWTAQEEKFIRREIEAGTIQRKIAEKLNVGIPTLKHRIRKLRGKE